jgi:chromatin remodeling complex protein RSC6
MPKQSKTKTTVDVVETATAPVVNTVIDVAAVEKVKKVKAPKVKAETVVSDVVSTAAPVQAAVTDAVESADVESDLAAQSTEFLAKLSQLSTLLASLKVEYRTLEKRWVRELKTAQKTQAKRKRKSGNRAPSGFVKPTKISDELAKFLEKPVGSEMARTDVTREINTYIRKHNLQDKENGRKINPDAKLQTLLKLKKTDELTYFNLQRYMSPHFSKAVKEVVA